MFELLGGRKFVAASLTAGAAMLCEMAAPHGLTMPMATLLLGVLGTFTAGNAMVTNAWLKTAPSQPATVDNGAPVIAMNEHGASLATGAAISNLSNDLSVVGDEILGRLNALTEASDTHGQALKWLVNFCQQAQAAGNQAHQVE